MSAASPLIARARTPTELLAALVASDPGRPRITWYDDADGPTRGERVELSARVIANWSAKAANLLVDEVDLERGAAVSLCLPAHWRLVYWALAAWQAGGVVVLVDAKQPVVADLLVTDREPLDGSRVGHLLAVSLPALARSWSGGPDGTKPLPRTAIDAAADLLSQGDAFESLDPAYPEEPAWQHGADATWSAAEVIRRARELAQRETWPAGARVLICGSPGDVLLATVAAWSVDGSVVLVREPDPALTDERLRSERITSAWPPAGRPAARS